MKVLSVASECAPLVKTGGLADVVGALPAALAAEGVEMRVLLPGYPAVMSALGDAEPAWSDADLMGASARLIAARVAGLDLLVLEAPHLYDRPGSIYLDASGRDWSDNPQRFAALSIAAARIGTGALPGWRPDVLHCHDWQAGWVPDHLAGLAPAAGRPGTVMTIHNIAFQGIADAGLIRALGLDPGRFTAEGYEYWGRISALKAGLMAADRITTVSPTYASELLTPEFGMGLDGVMRARRTVLTGILNGIDEAVWNPATDAHAPRYKAPAGKKKAKAALRAELGLPESGGPLCIVISRLTEQKGLDLLIEALPTLLAHGGQLALLGSGDPRLEDAFRAAARDDHVAVTIGYDEALSHRLMAGGDAILVPSRFEPCGLTQLYGLRYGTLPVVALTGGLADTVIHASPAARSREVATGIQFHPVSTDALRGAFDLLAEIWSNPGEWAQMQKNAMRQPVGWGPSAAAYARLYREVAPDA